MPFRGISASSSEEKVICRLRRYRSRWCCAGQDDVELLPRAGLRLPVRRLSTSSQRRAIVLVLHRLTAGTAEPLDNLATLMG